MMEVKRWGGFLPAMIMHRIEAEELRIDSAELVVTITRQEIEYQWGLYDGFDLELTKKLRHRAKHVSIVMVVICLE